MLKLTFRLGSFENVLNDLGRSADAVMTSPPYNLRGNAKKKTGTRNGNGGYDSKSLGSIKGYFDNMPEAEYQESQKNAIKWCWNVALKDNGWLLYNHKNRHRKGKIIPPYRWLIALEEDDIVVGEEFVWDRGSGHNHCKSIATEITERVYALRLDSVPRSKCTFNKDRRGSEMLSDILAIPRGKKFRHVVLGPNGEKVKVETHDAPFPLELPRRLLKTFAHPGDLVCDPYCGSGTTGIAAATLGMNFVGAEMNPDYYRMAICRVEEELHVRARRKNDFAEFKMS